MVFLCWCLVDHQWSHENDHLHTVWHTTPPLNGSRHHRGIFHVWARKRTSHCHHIKSQAYIFIQFDVLGFTQGPFIWYTPAFLKNLVAWWDGSSDKLLHPENWLVWWGQKTLGISSGNHDDYSCLIFPRRNSSCVSPDAPYHAPVSVGCTFCFPSSVLVPMWPLSCAIALALPIVFCHHCHHTSQHKVIT